MADKFVCSKCGNDDVIPNFQMIEHEPHDREVCMPCTMRWFDEIDLTDEALRRCRLKSSQDFMAWRRAVSDNDAIRTH